MKTLTYTIPCYDSFLDPQGQLKRPLPPFAGDDDYLMHRYRAMKRLRAFDKQAVHLQRTGYLGTFPSSLGQEALSVGIGAAMGKNDVLFPYYRDHGTLFERGVQLHEILAYWGGDERGNHYQHNPHDFPISVPIASQCLHAAGAAFALRYQGKNVACVCLCGDGATSKGDFYEAMNFAGLQKLPIVFIINNNRWAISVARDDQSATETLAQKAIAAGMDGQQIDGNDIVSVIHYVKQAIQKAIQGHPTVLEALTYRLSDHTTADDATRYQPPNMLKQAWEKEPIKRLAAYLAHQGLLTPSLDASIAQACEAEVEKAVHVYLKRPKAPATDLFDYLYKTLPTPLISQYQTLIKQQKNHEKNLNNKP